jgi:hypothetical protein
MAAINRARISNELVPGLNAIFGRSYKQYPAEHTQIYTTETSQRNYEEELKAFGMGLAPVKKEGQAVVYDVPGEGYRVRYYHETIAMAFSITQEAIEDNLYERQSKIYTEMLARSMAQTKQYKASAVLDRAFNNSYPGGDGVSLINTAHPLNQGTVSNAATTPTQLNETALENAAIQIEGWYDDRGLLINANPKKLIIPRQLRFQLKRLLDSPLRPSTSANDINAIRSLDVFPEGFAVNHYLANTTQWFVQTDVPNGMKHFERTALEYDEDNDFDTGNFRYKARERYSFNWSDPLAMYGSQGL